MKIEILRLNETRSTNAFALELLTVTRPDEGSVIVADYQTHGKGTDTNVWESENGKNLTFSLILYPGFTADRQFVMNKAVSLGILDFLRHELPEQTVTIKWPNDIYIGDKKVCGILIQNSVMRNRLDFVVVGIGLNVNQTVFTGNAPNPVSMKMVSGMEYIVEELLSGLVESIFARYAQVTPEDSEKIETDYYDALYRRMEWHSFIVKGVMETARITGTTEYGQLLLETEAGKRLVCDLKEVKFVV